MGRFKTPFTLSQKTSDIGDTVHKEKDVVRQDKRMSPLRIGHIDVITPKTKSKIKQRFAAQLAEENNMKATSPGVPVPFDLSQSQQALSQSISVVSQDLSVLDQSQPELQKLAIDDMEENTVLVHGASNDECIETVDHDLEFEDESNESNGSADVSGEFLLLSDDEVLSADPLHFEYSLHHGHKSSATLSILKQIQNQQNSRKKQLKSALKPCRKNRDFQQASTRVPKMNKRNKFLQTKRKVLSVISQMHHEIEVFQQKRAELRKEETSKDTSIGHPYEE